MNSIAIKPKEDLVCPGALGQPSYKERPMLYFGILKGGGSKVGRKLKTPHNSQVFPKAPLGSPRCLRYPSPWTASLKDPTTLDCLRNKKSCSRASFRGCIPLGWMLGICRGHLEAVLLKPFKRSQNPFEAAPDIPLKEPEAIFRISGSPKVPLE